MISRKRGQPHDWGSLLEGSRRKLDALKKRVISTQGSVPRLGTVYLSDEEDELGTHDEEKKKSR